MTITGGYRRHKGLPFPFSAGLGPNRRVNPPSKTADNAAVPAETPKAQAAAAGAGAKPSPAVEATPAKREYPTLGYE